ncbi:MAG: helix-turn-helix transcriptional regulator, partial [Gemmatimonadaceae bacterium]
MADPTSREIESSELGARLQAARKAARITQEDAALAINVARTTITAIEKGDRRVQANELVVLAQLYGKSLNELVRAGVSSKPLAVQ